MQKEQNLERIEKLRRKQEHSINARATTSYRAITNKKIHLL